MKVDELTRKLEGLRGLLLYIMQEIDADLKKIRRDGIE